VAQPKLHLEHPIVKSKTNNMNKVVILFSSLFIAINSFAQNNDVVYLKNGSIIKGKISEIKPDDYVKLQTYDGSLWVFKNSDIEKYEKADMQKEDEKENIKKKFFKVDIGFIIGNNVDNKTKAPLSLLAVYSLPVHKILNAGICIGFEFYQVTYMPVLLDLQLKPGTRGTSFTIQAGYTIPVKKNGSIDAIKYNFESGFLINPAINYTFPANQGTAFTISVGYRYQKTSEKQLDRYYNDDYRLKEEFNRLVLRFGYTFR
jgi:hypothetical protein